MVVKRLIDTTYNGLSAAYYEFLENGSPKVYAKHLVMSEATRRTLQIDYAKACGYTSDGVWEFMQEPKESFMCMEVTIDQSLSIGEVMMSYEL